MVASYRVADTPTKPVVVNKERSADDNQNKDYLYIDYDATDVYDDSDPIISDDDTIHKVQMADGTVYYTKRVYFAIEDTSLLMNKRMTVKYYPAIDYTVKKADNTEDHVRVVLYNYPLDFETHRVLYEDFESEGVNIADSSNSENKILGYTRSYNMPDAMHLPPARESRYNKANLQVTSGQYRVWNYDDDNTKRYMYYIDVPISESYYKKYVFTGVNFSDTNKDLYSFTYGGSGSGSVLLNKTKLNGAGNLPTDYAGELIFGLENNDRFEIEIQLALQYGKDPSNSDTMVGTRAVVFVRRGMFTLD